jgi:3-dehydroquinate synthase
LHGEAVAIGMFIAVLLSRDLEWLSQDATKKILTLLRVIPVEHLIAMLPAAPFLIEVMQSDKKVIQGRLYLVLLKSIGNAVLTADVSSEQIKKTLESNLLQAYLALLS